MFRSLFENSNIDVLETTIHPPSSTPHLSPANLSFSPEVTITNNHLVNRLLIWGVIYHHMYLRDKLKRPQGHLEKFGPRGEQWDGEPGLNCHFILCKLCEFLWWCTFPHLCPGYRMNSKCCWKLPDANLWWLNFQQNGVVLAKGFILLFM